jgi:phosphoribosylglycinamide formyltransferase-1
VFEAVLKRGCKVTGATSFFADSDGRVGSIIDQRAVAVLPGDTAEALGRRVMEEAEWPLLAEAVKLYCAGKLKRPPKGKK